ncbi:MAG: ornithine cyclodeaminase family protein, partial [Bacillota bacterium]|nr:ornithine cyclodeaminase family protein [Bacillota bacterium]
ITCVTTSGEPVFDGGKIKKGVHINAVGSFTPTTREIDEQTLLSADRVFVDTREGVLSEAGDLMIPIKKGVFDPGKAFELGEVISGKAEGRKNDGEITLFKTVGSAVLDVVTARRIYEKAVSSGACDFIEF